MAQSHDHVGLFPASSALHWLPDEIVFSLCSRYHLLAGNAFASTTCEELFGHARQGTQHDLPCRLDEFARRTAGHLGSALAIIQAHTLLPFYLPFRAAADATDANVAMRGPAIGALKYRLGISTSRFRANHPLKACCECLEVDEAEHGVGYWHRAHQFPGVWICAAHQAPLLTSTVKSTGVGRFDWHLPGMEHLTAASLTRNQNASQRATLEALAKFAQLAAELPRVPEGMRFESQPLLSTYHRALTQSGFTTASGGLKLRMIGDAYASAIAPLRSIYELSALPATAAEARTSVGGLVREPRTGTHPLRHLALIYWLFGSWRTFWDAYSQAADEVTSESRNSEAKLGGQPITATGVDERAVRIVELIRNDGHSVTHAARLVGVDTTTAMVWAARAGIAIPRRPKLLDESARLRLRRDLQRGHDKQVVATKYGISIQTVTTTLRTQVGLHAAWKAAQFEAARRAARSAWQDAIHRQGHAGIKAVRTLVPAQYGWLYRNDRAWLTSTCAALPAARRSNNSQVDWDERDTALSEQVQRVLLQLTQSAPKGKVALWQVYQVIPELKAKLGSLHRLPLTQRALATVIGRRRPDAHSGVLI